MKSFLNSGESSVIGWLNADTLMRSDVELSMQRTLRNKLANVFIRVEAPHNVTQRDMDLDISLQRDGDENPLTIADFSEFDVVAEDFYRDIILERIFNNLFNDVRIDAR
jgi:hypothetical protein